jgi:hypothetical protein
MQQTMLVGFVLDESGSMDSCKSAAISGTNEYLETLKKDRADHPELGEVFLTLAKFSSRGAGWGRSSEEESSNIRFIYNLADIREVETLTEKDYMPSGGTPLLEAIGRTIESVDEFLAKSTPAKPQTEEGAMPAALANFLGGNETAEETTAYKIVIVVQTDGGENTSSKKYVPKEKIQKLIKEREAQGNWTFVFLGAGIDAVSDGMTLGVAAGNTVSYAANSEATREVYAAAGMTTSELRHRTGIRGMSNFGEVLKSHVAPVHLTDEKNKAISKVKKFESTKKKS